jgi:hypothetical protein
MVTKLAYILAASHSGSTLLTMLLNSHPDVATVGELAPGGMGDLSWYLCSCGTRLRECSFWQYVSSAMKRNGNHFDLEDFGTRFSMPESRIATWLLGPLHRGPVLELLRDTALGLITSWPDRLAEIARRNEAIIEVILDYYHARIFVDKGNRALRLKYLLRIPSLDVKVIRLIRDGRAVALTYMDPAGFADAKDTARRGGGSGGNRENERLEMAQAAYQWRRCNKEAEHVIHRLDKAQWTEIRYEDLCNDTDNTLNRIFEFFDLDPDQRAKDFRSVEHHVVGNGMRLDSTSEIRLDERWRSVLTEEDLKTFDRVAGKMNRKYGYE